MLQRLVSFATILLGARLLLGANSAAPPQQQSTPPNTAGQNQVPFSNAQNNAGSNFQNAAKPQYWYGVAVEKISPAIARQLKLRPDQGLMVLAILSDSPAAKAGLKADDLLIELNGKPLVSQEDLALAANGAQADKSGNLPASNFILLRDGDRKSAEVTPALRPEQMLVVGNNTALFSPQNNIAENVPTPANGPAQNAESFTNYVAPNGNSLLVGSGHQIDLQSQSAGTVNIRRAVANGQRVILSQETDPSGKIRNTITQAQHTYSVEPGHLDEIPENIRGLAQQMLAESGQPATAPATSAGEMGRQLTEQQIQIKSLEQQVNSLRETIESLQRSLPPQKSNGSN